MMPQISAIILTLNSEKFIGPCLDSIYAHNLGSLEVIVVDNGSSDGTTEFIKTKYPQVVLIENKSNLGTCKARNQAIKVSRGEWVLTLDSDTVLENNFFRGIDEAISNAPEDIGIIQPKILRPDRRTIYSVGIFLSHSRRFYDLGQGQRDNGKFNLPLRVFGACSAAALYRRKMLEHLKEETGYFDERFFFLVEDVDLAWRAKKQGWKTLFQPELVCYHYGNSSNHEKNIRQQLSFRNRFYTIKKMKGCVNMCVR